MKDNGRMIKLTERVNTFMLTVQYMKVIGCKINNMEKDLKLGKILQNMKVIIQMEKSMAKVLL